MSGDLLHVTNKVSGCDIFGRESIVSLLSSNLTDWSVGFSADLLRVLPFFFSPPGQLRVCAPDWIERKRAISFQQKKHKLTILAVGSIDPLQKFLGTNVASRQFRSH